MKKLFTICSVFLVFLIAIIIFGTSPQKIQEFKISQYDIILNEKKEVKPLIIFHSLTCSHCKDLNDELKTEFKDTYIIKRHFIRNKHDLMGAKILSCVPDILKSKTMDSLYEKLPTYDSNSLQNLSKELGLERFDSCINDKKLEDNLVELQKENWTYNINATPSYIINDILYTGINLNKLKELLQK